jgi:DNA-binding NtrC family response regulator
MDHLCENGYHHAGMDQTLDHHPISGAGAHRGVPLKVSVISGPDIGREVSIESQLEVGTDATLGLVLTDPTVSKKHLLISVTDGRIVVKDLGSRNGSFFGGAKITELELPIGALLRLGETELTVQLRWYLREVPASTARQFGELLGESVAMREVFSILERASYSDAAVLIEGESGTGKELAARSVHYASEYAKGPYVVFDCGAVPSELAESELFGHKRGAFSGATSDRMGAFQQADGGTLCLDEIGELPPDLQPKLLRVLETGEIKAVGADTIRKVKVRVVAATNRDLLAESRRGNFRSDLFYRLEVLRVRMPPLRQRPEDVPGLIAKLLQGKLPEGDRIAGTNLRKLVGYGWPGNVRELRNALVRAVTLAQLPGAPRTPFEKLVFNLGPASKSPLTIGAEYPGIGSNVPFKEAKAQILQSFEQHYLSSLLDRHKGNITKAAAAAGLSRKHLYELMRKIDLFSPDLERE